jgi:hypothetical protein
MLEPNTTSSKTTATGRHSGEALSQSAATTAFAIKESATIKPQGPCWLGRGA